MEQDTALHGAADHLLYIGKNVGATGKDFLTPVVKPNNNFQPDRPTLVFERGCLVESSFSGKVAYNSVCVLRRSGACTPTSLLGQVVRGLRVKIGVSRLVKTTGFQ